MIYRDDWYYLLGTHGSCCAGGSSGYNIRVGRAKHVTGPFVDNMDVPLLEGGGKLLIGSGGRVVGPGHFGLIDLGDEVQKFSMHWEADLDRGGASVLDIRPLLWKDGWPIAGENLKEGTYEIESVRTGTALQLAVEDTPVGGRRGRGGRGRGGRGPADGAVGRGQGGPGAPAAVQADQGTPAGDNAAGGDAAGRGNGRGTQRRGGGRGLFGGQGGVIPNQDVAQVSANWPAGNIDVRLSNYMLQAQQKWTVAPVADAGGFLGSPFFKIMISGTDRALAATEDGELVTVPAFTGGPQQLWQIDQLTDGTYRIMPKAALNSKERLALSAIGSSSATLSKFDPNSDKQRWLFKTP